MAKKDEYWHFGRKELVCISTGTAIFAGLSLLLQAAPPWWFLPLPGRAARQFDRWAQYAEQGGYAAHWFHSLYGWAIVGAVPGLIFSNVILRGKSWD